MFFFSQTNVIHVICWHGWQLLSSLHKIFLKNLMSRLVSYARAIYLRTSGIYTFGSNFKTRMGELPNTAEPPELNFEATAQACTKYRYKCTKYWGLTVTCYWAQSFQRNSKHRAPLTLKINSLQIINNNLNNNLSILISKY